MPFVEDGMRVGLGTGTTARWFILGLAERVRDGLKIRAVATSVASAALATEHGIDIGELGADGLDLAVDGAELGRCHAPPDQRQRWGDGAREDCRGGGSALRCYCR